MRRGTRFNDDRSSCVRDLRWGKRSAIGSVEAQPKLLRKIFPLGTRALDLTEQLLDRVDGFKYEGNEFGAQRSLAIAHLTRDVW